MENWKDRVFYNTQPQTYGKALKLRAFWLRALFIGLCLITPATNWMIPLVVPRIKDYMVRWG